jgi:hypothetical protein
MQAHMHTQTVSVEASQRAAALAAEAVGLEAQLLQSKSDRLRAEKEADGRIQQVGRARVAEG